MERTGVQGERAANRVPIKVIQAVSVLVVVLVLAAALWADWERGQWIRWIIAAWSLTIPASSVAFFLGRRSASFSETRRIEWLLFEIRDEVRAQHVATQLAGDPEFVASIERLAEDVERGVERPADSLDERRRRWGT